MNWVQTDRHTDCQTDRQTEDVRIAVCLNFNLHKIQYKLCLYLICEMKPLICEMCGFPGQEASLHLDQKRYISYANWIVAQISWQKLITNDSKLWSFTEPWTTFSLKCTLSLDEFTKELRDLTSPRLPYFIKSPPVFPKQFFQRPVKPNSHYVFYQLLLQKELWWSAF